jgi:hypothetical protein
MFVHNIATKIIRLNFLFNYLLTFFYYTFQMFIEYPAATCINLVSIIFNCGILIAIFIIVIMYVLCI